MTLPVSSGGYSVTQNVVECTLLHGKIEMADIYFPKLIPKSNTNDSPLLLLGLGLSFLNTIMLLEITYCLLFSILFNLNFIKFAIRNQDKYVS